MTSSALERRRFAAVATAMGLTMLGAGYPQPASAASINFDCKVDQVGVFVDHIFTRCESNASGVYIFAYPTKNAAQAARILNVLTGVTLGGVDEVAVITFDPADVSGASIGCPPSNCRTIQAVHVSQ
jgi:hypothetical protein